MEDRHKTACPAISHLSSILQNESNNMSFCFVNPMKQKRPTNQQIIHRKNEIDVGMIGLLCLQIHSPYCCTNMRQI